MIYYYSSLIMDTSSFSLATLGKVLTNWSIQDITQKADRIVNEDEQALFTIYFEQSHVQNTYEWSINSLDVVLGLVGGVSSVIWSTLAYFMNGYE